MSDDLPQADLPEAGGRPIRSARDIVRFAFAGKARLSVVSLRSQARYTFEISEPKNQQPGEDVRFVSVLTGVEGRYAYLGLIDNLRRPTVRLTRKSTYGADAAPVKAARFLCERVLAHPDAPVPADLEVWHEGRCGRCARPLTVPESIERGIGPECWHKLGGS